MSRAVRIIFDPAFIGIAAKAVALALLLFAGVLALAEWGLSLLPVLCNPMVNKALELLAPVLTIFLIGTLGGPVVALFGSLFLDSLAGRIEARDYPQHPPALPGSFWTTFRTGLRLFAMILGADIVLLPFDLALPGLGFGINLLVNGWLLGWEYFELVALRHVPVAEADRLRHLHRGKLWLAGTMIAVLSVVPLVNLIAPLFGTALMVHLFKRLSGTASA